MSHREHTYQQMVRYIIDNVKNKGYRKLKDFLTKQYELNEGKITRIYPPEVEVYYAGTTKRGKKNKKWRGQGSKKKDKAERLDIRVWFNVGKDLHVLVIECKKLEEKITMELVNQLNRYSKAVSKENTKFHGLVLATNIKPENKDKDKNKELPEGWKWQSYDEFLDGIGVKKKGVVDTIFEKGFEKEIVNAFIRGVSDV